VHRVLGDDHHRRRQHRETREQIEKQKPSCIVPVLLVDARFPPHPPPSSRRRPDHDRATRSTSAAAIPAAACSFHPRHRRMYIAVGPGLRRMTERRQVPATSSCYLLPAAKSFSPILRSSSRFFAISRSQRSPFASQAAPCRRTAPRGSRSRTRSSVPRRSHRRHASWHNPQ